MYKYIHVLRVCGNNNRTTLTSSSRWQCIIYTAAAAAYILVLSWERCTRTCVPAELFVYFLNIVYNITITVVV